MKLRVFAVLIVMSLPASVFAASDTAGYTGNSENWAGYVATANSYTGVGGSWTVPVPQNTSQSSLAADATWVGIGGLSSQDLIQAGTQAVVENGYIQYQAWYEALPDSQQTIPSLVVHGGDSVSVDLQETSTGIWHLTFTNNSTGTVYNTDIAYNSSHSSADWIEEMPLAVSGAQTGYLPLDQFGTVTMTGAYATVNGSRVALGATDAMPLTMSTQQAVLAQPSGISNDSFSVTRTAAVSSPSYLPIRRGLRRTGSGTSGFVRHRDPRGLFARARTSYGYSGPGYQVRVFWY